MDLIYTKIEGLIIIKPKIFEDDRGYFFESFNKQKLDFINYDFIQDNESKSSKDTIRGMHFQISPYEQGKLVRVIKGSVLDVAVDLRKNSLTYKQYVSIELNDKNKLLFWIPPGFAHGFKTLEDDTIFFYKCTNSYDKNSEKNFIWNDPEININWNITNPILSEKDRNAPLFKDLK